MNNKLILIDGFECNLTAVRNMRSKLEAGDEIHITSPEVQHNLRFTPGSRFYVVKTESRRIRKMYVSINGGPTMIQVRYKDQRIESDGVECLEEKRSPDFVIEGMYALPNNEDLAGTARPGRGSVITDPFPPQVMNQPLDKGHPYVENINTQHGDVFKVSFSNYDVATKVKRLNKGQWFTSVMNMLESLGMDEPGDTVAIASVMYNDGHIGAIIDLGHRNRQRQYYVLNKMAGTMMSCPAPAGDYDVRDTLIITCVDINTKEAEFTVTETAKKEWIPHSGQFVLIKDDPKKILYVMHDYDQIEHRFILVMADKAQRDRNQHIAEGSEYPNCISVSPDKIRPYLLSY